MDMAEWALTREGMVHPLCEHTAMEGGCSMVAVSNVLKLASQWS